MLRGEIRKHILLWGWTALIFVWQSAIFNPSMRYQLLIYPILAIFASWAVFRLFGFRGRKTEQDEGFPELDSEGEQTDRTQLTQHKNKWPRLIAIILGAGVLIATALYAFGFSNIYTRPITRVEASRWIYQNIPGPISLPIQTGNDEILQQISYPYNYQISQEIPFITNFKAQQSGALSEIVGYRVIDPRASLRYPVVGGNHLLQIWIWNSFLETRKTYLSVPQPLNILSH